MHLEEFVKHTAAAKAMIKAAKEAIKGGEDEGTYAVVIAYCTEADDTVTFESLQVSGGSYINPKGNLTIVSHCNTLREIASYKLPKDDK